MIMIVTAVLLAAACAGIVLMDEESYAADAENYTITYDCDGGVLYQTGAAGAAVTLYKNEATNAILGLDENSIYKLAGWQTVGDNPSVYRFNSDGVATIVLSSDITLVPFLEIKENVEVANFVLDGKTYVLQITGEKVTLTEDILDAIAALGDDKEFKGWFDAAGTELKADAGDGNENTFTVTADTTYTAKIIDIYKVSWVVDGITVAEGTSEAPGKPVTDPSRDNYTFKGWFDAAGVQYTVDDASTTADEGYVFIQDTVFTASFEADLITVTFVAGDETVGTVEVRYGNTVMNPALPEGYVAWAVDAEGTASFDFDQPIVADVTVYAVAAVPSDVFTVTFVVDGEVIATYASNSVTLPDAPSKEGFEFVGWSINNSVIADPVNYEFAADTQFVALFQAIDVTTYTVTIQMADGTTQNIKVAEGEVPELPALAEGKVWALGDEIFNPETAIATDIVLKEVDEYYTVSFAVNGTVYDAYAQEVKYGEKASAPAQFVFPDGYSGWDFNFDTVIISDVTVNAALIPAPAEEPAFYETTTGQAAIVLVVFVIVLFVAAVYMNIGGLREKLFGWKITRKD